LEPRPEPVVANNTSSLVYAGSCEECISLRYEDGVIMEMKPVGPHEDEHIDLTVLLNQLRANKWLVIIVTLITMSCGFLYLRHKVPLYQSDVLIQIDTNHVGQGGFAEKLAFGGSSQLNAVITQIALIQSRFILNQVVELLGLQIRAEPETLPVWKRIFQHSKNKEYLQVKALRCRSRL